MEILQNVALPASSWSPKGVTYAQGIFHDSRHATVAESAFPPLSVSVLSRQVQYASLSRLPTTNS